MSSTHQYWLGKKRPNLFNEDSIKKMAESHTGEKAYNYKGDDVGYVGLHNWVRRMLGTPKKCSHCGSETAKKYEWANLSGEYKRDVSDWVRLCVSCHHKKDDTHKKLWETRRKRVYKKVVPWNKGLKMVRTGKCSNCGNVFTPKKKTNIFCSNSCSMKNKWKTGVISR